MNKISYKILTSLNNQMKEIEEIDLAYIESLYQYYIDHVKKIPSVEQLSKQDFMKIFCIMYDILKFYLTKEEIELLSQHYLSLLIADLKDGYEINLAWWIDHIWYLGVGNPHVEKNKYKNCLLFFQQECIKQFKIKEKTPDKIKRKLRTNLFIK